MRSKVYALINLLGLTIGLASVLIIGIYVQFETSYDEFLEDSERIHRIALHRIYPGRTKDFGTSVAPLAPVLNAHYPEVEVATRLFRIFFQNERTITFPDNDQSFIETKYLFADSLFFDVFSYTFLHGDSATALDNKESVVLTRSTALRYFDTDDVVGRSILSDDSTLVVTGVIEDPPANSHIHFDVLGSMASLGFLQSSSQNANWWSPSVNTYVKLKQNIDAQAFEAKFYDLVEVYGGGNLSSDLGENWRDEGHAFEYYLQPIQSIHLHSNTDVEIEPNSNVAYIYVLSAIAVIILLISAINFINLSTARSVERAQEVGIRKVLGSHRSTLIYQFLAEAMILAGLSACLALASIGALVPRFNGLLGTHLTFDILRSPWAWISIIGLVVVVGILSGLYPALAISSIRPARVLKGRYRSSEQGVWLRNSLIVLQFLVSIVMISGSIIAAQQMRFLQSKDLGFQKDHMLVVKQGYRLGSNYAAFTNELRALSGLSALGGANMLPGNFHGSNVFQVSDPDIADIRVNTLTVDDDFLEAIGIEVLAGRGFQPEFNDSLSVIINESAAYAMGRSPEQVLGLKFSRNITNTIASELKVVGVVRDYHFYSLHSEIGPMAISNGTWRFIPESTVIRIRPGQTKEVLEAAAGSWQNLSTAPFNYSFLASDLDSLYQSDRNTATLFNVFTYIAILMSCVGLFGLATYMVNQRAKEMSIRKVLGGSIGHIIRVFSKDFLLLIGLAFLIGVPVAYLALHLWLDDFAYHVDVHPMYFLLAGGVTLMLVFVTVSYQALKLAFVNPVKMLRSE
ncbi:MAG: ABC transporter permease [Bacteroidota bacterium]